MKACTNKRHVVDIPDVLEELKSNEVDSCIITCVSTWILLSYIP